MIPKTIHYCWFGRNPKPKLAKKCIRSWKRHCKGYKIIEWNEDNIDISAMPLYVRQAYEAKKWAFVTDYVRLWVIYEYGGIYFDTDVEVFKPLDDFLQCKAFFGLERKEHVNTGLGFGAEKGTYILEEMMSDYDSIPFLREDGTEDVTPCPQRNTMVLQRHGLAQINALQDLDDGIVIFPTEYFCPRRSYDAIVQKTENTYTVHHFAASWYSKKELKAKRKKEKKQRRFYRKDKIFHFPNRILIRLLGEEKYGHLKKLMKRG